MPEGTCREDKMVTKPRILLLVLIFARHWPLGFPKRGGGVGLCLLVGSMQFRNVIRVCKVFEEVESALAPTSIVAPQLDRTPRYEPTWRCRIFN